MFIDLELRSIVHDGRAIKCTFKGYLFFVEMVQDRIDINVKQIQTVGGEGPRGGCWAYQQRSGKPDKTRLLHTVVSIM